ncbi:hypothetical protein [Paenibacillus agaridevorans]|uniref:hypothetical protein n=1 Tax=Paenibacillus agaridevorans TaxID=171404 RepID=UPI001BE44D29|nr:hypothetical protein [Paenibacillus agaridevorans]
MKKTNKQPKFGSFAAHQPNYDAFQRLGVGSDFVYQSLSHMGDAKHKMSWAATVIEDADMPKEIKQKIVEITQEIGDLQEQLRPYKTK